MKKGIIISLLSVAFMLGNNQTVNAEEIEVYHSIATAYCTSGTTAAGTQTKEGLTVASKKEWIGSTMIMWVDDGDGHIKPENYIGTFVVEDTGGEAIKNGAVIDLFISDYDEAVNFGSKKVVYQVIKSEG